MLILFFLNPAVIVADSSGALEQSPPRAALYTYTTPSRDGIGKLYMGREIAQVMGYQGAEWLERESRESQERPDLLLQALDIQPGQHLADIGAGSGFYTRRLAQATGANGRVYAVDVQPQMLDLLAQRLQAEGIRNVRLVQGAAQTVHLPAGRVDLALLVDVYHEFAFPYEMIESICAASSRGLGLRKSAKSGPLRYRARGHFRFVLAPLRPGRDPFCHFFAILCRFLQ